MADKDEVGPTEESGAAGPSETPDPAGSSAGGDARSPESRADRVAEPPADDAGDEFDEIVRGSGLSGAHAIGPADDDADHDENIGGDNPDGIEEKALEPAGVGAAAASSSSSTLAERRAARKPKDAATKRRDTVTRPERTGPVKFVRESVGELRKVVYPTGQQLINYFVVVLVFVLFIIAYVSLLDLGLGAAIFKIFS